MFVVCKVPSVKYRGDIINNEPLNLDLVEMFRKDTVRNYPDNIGLPAIIFKTARNSYKWVFNTEEEREETYNNLLLVR